MASAPTYALEEVKRLIAAGACRVTTTAEHHARDDLGLTRDALLRCVRQLSGRDFYKTMPSEKMPGHFQDVYRRVFETPLHQGGIEVYCKVQIVQGRTVVISFKLR